MRNAGEGGRQSNLPLAESNRAVEGRNKRFEEDGSLLILPRSQQVQDPSFTPQRSTFLESCWPCLPKRTVIGFDRCRSFLRITPDFLIAYLIHSSPTSVHTPSHILSLSPWIPPRAIVHSKSVSALEPSLVYHSLYGQRQIRLIHDPRFLNTIADSCAP